MTGRTQTSTAEILVLRYGIFWILLLGLMLRLHGFDWGLPNQLHLEYSYHPDETYLLTWAGWLHEGKTIAKHFIYGGTFYYTILQVNNLLGAWVAQLIDAPQLYTTILLGRTMGVVCGLITIALVWRIGKELFNREVGLMAALILAVMPGHVFWAQRVRPDELFTLLYVLNVFILVRILKNIGAPLVNLISGGLLLGVSIATRFPAGVLFIAYATAFFIANKKYYSAQNPTLLTFRHLLVVMVVCILGYSITSPYTFIYFKQFINGLKVTLYYESGQDPISGGPLWFQYAVSTMSQSLGYPFYALFLFSLAWSLWNRKKTDYLLLSVFLPYFFLVINVSVIVVRYTVPLLPVCAILIARFLCELYTSRDRLRPLVIGIFALALAWSLAADTAYSNAIKDYDVRDSAALWIGKNIQPGAKIADFIAYNGDFFANPPAIPSLRQQWYHLNMKRDDIDFIIHSLRYGYYDYIIINEDYLKDARKLGSKMPQTPYKNLFQWSETHPGYTLLQEFSRKVSFAGIDFRTQFSAKDYAIAYPTIHLYQRNTQKQMH